MCKSRAPPVQEMPLRMHREASFLFDERKFSTYHVKQVLSGLLLCDDRKAYRRRPANRQRLTRQVCRNYVYIRYNRCVSNMGQGLICVPR